MESKRQFRCMLLICDKAAAPILRAAGGAQDGWGQAPWPSIGQLPPTAGDLGGIRSRFNTTTLAVFWIEIKAEYPEIGKKALRPASISNISDGKNWVREQTGHDTRRVSLSPVTCLDITYYIPLLSSLFFHPTVHLFTLFRLYYLYHFAHCNICIISVYTLLPVNMFSLCVLFVWHEDRWSEVLS